MICERCGTEISSGDSKCYSCGAAVPGAEKALAQSDKMPMKWYCVLAYFGLWVSGLVTIINGYLLFSGGHIIGDTETFYEMFNGLQTADIVMGLVSMAAGLFGFVTASCLIAMKSFAPKMVPIYYAVNLVSNIIYSIIYSSIIKMSAFNVNFIVELIITAVFMVVNIIYFKKRDHLFVN